MGKCFNAQLQDMYLIKPWKNKYCSHQFRDDAERLKRLRQVVANMQTNAG